MQRVETDLLRPGMIVGQDLYNEWGQTLLARGTALNDAYIYGLRVRGFPALWVMDGISDDVHPPDLLTPKARAATSAHVRSFFTIAQKLGIGSDGSEPLPDLTDEFAAAAKGLLLQLYGDAEHLVAQVARAKAASGVMAIKSYDNYTYEHSVEMAIAATLLGQRVGMEEWELEMLALGCLLHDLGKVAVPREILNKPDNLTDEESTMVRRHPELGFRLALKLLGEGDITPRNIIRQHHERQDGTGYSQGLHGSNRFSLRPKRQFGARAITPAAEIAAVADVYSALASDRPYCPAMKPEQVISLLKEMAGPHLNQQLVADYLRIVPAYPLCSEVAVTSGRLQGYRGVVTQINPGQVNRPVIRVLFDPAMRGVAPFEVDTAKEKDIDLASPSFAEIKNAICG